MPVLTIYRRTDGAYLFSADTEGEVEARHTALMEVDRLCREQVLDPSAFEIEMKDGVTGILISSKVYNSLVDLALGIEQGDAWSESVSDLLDGLQKAGD